MYIINIIITNMVNTMQEAIFSELSVVEQRELLQKMNNDKLAAVFDKVGENPKGLELTCLENVLCCYPNQLEDGQVELPDDFWEWQIVILNLWYDYDSVKGKNKIEGFDFCKWGLRKWKVEVIAGNSENLPTIENPLLLSPWVIEYYESEKSWQKYTQTVLRDGWQMNTSEWISTLADANERTTTAGRNFSGNLNEDLEIENAEESPFLMRNEKGEYYLVTHDLNYKKHLIASIENFLENKYLSPEDENYTEVKSAFERKFTEVTYEELWAILRTIIANDRFAEYSWEKGEIDALDNTDIELDGQIGTYYVFHDKKNNTIEYRAIRRITWFPEWLRAVGKLPLRLFLESQNQNPSFKNIENIWKHWAGNAKLVPTIQDVASKVSETMNP